MQIIGIAGSKGAGKSSAAKYITGMYMKKANVIEWFDIDDLGNLLVNCETKDGAKTVQGKGVFDLDRHDNVFVNYLTEMVWPHVKMYSFADALKWILVNLYGVSHTHLFGTQEQKNELSNIKWEQFAGLINKKDGPKGIKNEDLLTYRQVMQYFADILRAVDGKCFIYNTLRDLEMEQVPTSIVVDIRREDEVDAVINAGGKVFYLLRTSGVDEHKMENGLASVDQSKFAFIIDNRDLTIHAKNIAIENNLKELGLI